MAEARKMGGAVALFCKGVNITFRPVAMETTGALGKQAGVAVKALVTRLGLMKGVPRAEAVVDVMRGLQVTLMKGCGEMLVKQAAWC